MDAIPGFPDYYATTEGQIISTKGREPRVLKAYRDKLRYTHVSLRRDGQTFTRSVHTLVALTYLGAPPEGMEVRHLDGDPSNNTLSNLRYGTHSENQQDQLIHGTNKEARKTHCAQGHSYAKHGMPPLKGRPNSRRCRKCHSVWIARWRAKKKVTARHTDSLTQVRQ